MPELPEVETVRRTLELAIKGETITSVIIRYGKIIHMDNDAFKKQVIGQTIERIDRMGKYLIFYLTQDVMIIHLRMEGKFFIKQDEPFTKHEHIIFTFQSGKELRYHDTRKFGTIDLLPKSSYLNVLPLSQLGKEPKDLTVNELYQSIKTRKRPIKSVLLDQTIIAGLGNIYVDETLFRAHIHPMRLASKVKKKDVARILESAQAVLEKAVNLGGTTIRSYTSSLGVTGRFQNELLVHMKKDEPCPICLTPIIKIKVGGRGTYVCPKCQS